MECTELFHCLNVRGFSLHIDGERLRITGDFSEMTDDLDAAIRANKQALIDLLTFDVATDPVEVQPEPVPHEQPPYVARCKRCGGADWGCVGSAPDGGEVWSCLMCWSSAMPTHCPVCQGDALVYDSGGAYCVGCCQRIGVDAAPPAEPVDETAKDPAYIGVSWSHSKGYLRLADPATGEIAEIPAKGLPKEERWLYERLDGPPRKKTHDHTVTEHPIIPFDNTKLPVAPTLPNPSALTRCYLCGGNDDISPVTGMCVTCRFDRDFDSTNKA